MSAGFFPKRIKTKSEIEIENMEISKAEATLELELKKERKSIKRLRRALYLKGDNE